MYCNVYDFGTILWGKFCCTNLFSKEPKNLDIINISGCSKFRFIQSVRNPGGKNRRNVVLEMAKGNIITEKKKETQSLQLLLILNWKAIEKDQQLISESTFVIT
jgi:hypothetical protein